MSVEHKLRVILKGTPAQFAVMLRHYNDVEISESFDAVFVVTEPNDDKISPDANPVRVEFGHMSKWREGYTHRGVMTAFSIPGRMTSLSISSFSEDGWPEIELLWCNFYAYLGWNGWLDSTKRGNAGLPHATTIASVTAILRAIGEEPGKYKSLKSACQSQEVKPDIRSIRNAIKFAIAAVDYPERETAEKWLKRHGEGETLKQLEQH